MSHLIIEGIDLVFTPKGGEFEGTWHGLQTVLDDLTDRAAIAPVLRPIIQCGFVPDFSGELSTVPDDVAGEVGLDALTDWKLIMADLRENGNGLLPVHVAKSGYTIHQNEALLDAMLDALTEVVGPNGYEIATIGTLGAYSQFFVSIALKGDSGFTLGRGKHADKHSVFFNLNSSHNGLVGSNLMLSVIRQVCMNTVQASIQDSNANGTRSVIKHTKNSEQLITAAAFAKSLELWKGQVERHKALLLALKAEPMTLDQFRAFAAGVFTNPKSDSLSTTSFNRVSEMEDLFLRGKGNCGKTRLDGFNAVTEYFTHGNGTGNSERVAMAKRVASANFGRANDWKLEAERVLSCPEEFAAANERGRRLYGEKLETLQAAN